MNKAKRQAIIDVYKRQSQGHRIIRFSEKDAGFGQVGGNDICNPHQLYHSSLHSFCNGRCV